MRFLLATRPLVASRPFSEIPLYAASICLASSKVFPGLRNPTIYANRGLPPKRTSESPLALSWFESQIHLRFPPRVCPPFGQHVSSDSQAIFFTLSTCKTLLPRSLDLLTPLASVYPCRGVNHNLADAWTAKVLASYPVLFARRYSRRCL